MKIGDIAEITKLAGFEYSKYFNYTDSGEIIALRALNVKNGRLDLSSIKKIEKKISDSLPRSKLYKNDIILTYTGSLLGEVALIDKDNHYHLAPNVSVIRSKKVDPYFLFSYMRSKTFKKYLKQFIVGSGQPTIPMKNIREIPINLPDEITINLTTNTIKNIDKKIDLNLKKNQILETIAKLLFNSWFRKFEPFKKKENFFSEDVKKYFPENFYEIDNRQIPLNWELLKVKDILTRVKVGKRYNNKNSLFDGKIPIIDQSKDGILGYHNDNEYIEASTKNPVITFSNHTCNIRLLFENFSTIQNVIPLIPKKVPIFWSYLSVQDLQKFEEYRGHIPDFLIKEIAVPNKDLINLFENLITPFFKKIFLNEKQNRIYLELIDSLISNLTLRKNNVIN